MKFYFYALMALLVKRAYRTRIGRKLGVHWITMPYTPRKWMSIPYWTRRARDEAAKKGKYYWDRSLRMHLSSEEYCKRVAFLKGYPDSIDDIRF